MTELKPTGVAEIAVRVSDLDRSCAFYEEVLGLSVFGRFEAMAFFEIAALEPGHPQLLALFTEDWPSTRDGHGWEGLSFAASPLHHFALSTRVEDLPGWEARLTAAGVPFNRRVFDWVGWRSLFFQDPDGTVVELVSVDRTALRVAQSEAADS